MMKKILFALVIGQMTGSVALAQSQESRIPSLDDTSRKGEMARLAERNAQAKFDAADEDKDGVLSRVELAKHMPYFDQKFERFDKSKDGVLSWEEFVGHDKWKREPKQK
jgi:Ca2+-binding EF-hand superfamily protein